MNSATKKKWSEAHELISEGFGKFAACGGGGGGGGGGGHHWLRVQKL